VTGPKSGVSASDPQTRARALLFGQNVRERRKALGLSQEGLAKLAGAERQSVNRVENAAYSPSLARILRLADALGVKPAALFEDMIIPPPNGAGPSAPTTPAGSP
jgi:putative transcriptional regulator